ncbi:8-amino-7-oxononanoate synthase [Acidovorax sp. HDW3]|uniref:8-amino-7-oxononanoate synthase n=1 Tax=Acidovorax sp. HDW3 TaxID=2714923 RepID=UPI0014092EC4|nr:8-amino-7-oxononanoate synthase [Acidovorax sp. HDW3]QIL43229.1 8-amino-7-oxononanoate synthase [Acidovorax sp. HDW3]
MEHSSSRLLADVDAQLAQWQAQGLLRQRRTVQSPCSVAPQVQGQRLLAFASNDYLGLANHPAIAAALAEGAQRWGAGSGASHVVSGHLQPVAELEEALAAFVGRAQALFFSSGYLANLAALPALLERGDVVFHDKLNHASLIDAVRLGRAQDWRYPHGDMAALERLLQQHRGRRAMIVSDAVFSMDGDVAPLRQLYALACAHDAWLVLDDAHGLGVLGPGGAGSLAQAGLPPDPRIVHIGTLGKAAGVAGAFVAGDARVLQWLVQRARPYIFTTASPPALACALLAALPLVQAGDALRAQLQARIAQLRAGLAGSPWRLLPSDTAIQPLLLGSNEAALAASQALQAQGLWVPAIRPPTVPVGSARLRISLSAAHSAGDVARLLQALQGLAP